MAWIWKIVALMVMWGLSYSWRTQLRHGVTQIARWIVSISLISGTWMILLTPSRGGLLQSKWGLELDPVQEIILGRVSIGLLTAYTLASVVVAVWRIGRARALDSLPLTSELLRIQALGSSAQIAVDYLYQARILEKIKINLPFEAYVLLSKSSVDPHLVQRTGRIVAKIPIKYLKAPMDAVDALIRDYVYKKYWLRQWVPILALPFSLAPLGTIIDGPHCLSMRRSSFLAAGVISVLSLSLGLGTMFIPGPTTLNPLRSGTSRTALLGWQMLQTDMDTRIWTTVRGGIANGVPLPGIIIDTRPSRVPYIRIHPGVRQRFRGLKCVSYKFTARLRGAGAIRPIVMALATPGSKVVGTEETTEHRTYIESSLSVFELKPGTHTYYVTHDGPGDLATDFQLRVPPGWVLELRDMQATAPGQYRQRIEEAREAWRLWNVEAMKLPGSLPSASLSWTLAEGIRR